MVDDNVAAFDVAKVGENSPEALPEWLGCAKR
jgi:hypothetical protein